MKRGYLLLLILITLPALPAHANYYPDEWSSCQIDDECVKAPGVCWCWAYQDVAINKAYATRFAEKYSPVAGLCMNGGPPAGVDPRDGKCKNMSPLGPDAVAKCIDRKCALVHLSSKELYKEWRQCQSDDECGIKRGGCGDVTANKKYMDKVEPSPYCTKPAGPHDPSSFAKCVDNQCVVRIPGRPE